MEENEIKCEYSGETPCSTESNEYDDKNGYYISISYSDNLLTIIVYNMELLDQKKFEISIELKELMKKHESLKKLRTTKKIYDLFNDLIEKNNYKIIQDELFIKFYFYLSEINSNKYNDKIGFILKVDKHKDENEYIKFLCNTIRKSRIQNIIQEKPKKEVKTMNIGKKLLNEEGEKQEKEINIKKSDLNCAQRPLIPEIHLDLKKIHPTISTRCQNGHSYNRIKLLNYLEENKKFSKINFKCNCQKGETESDNLFYCDTCQILFCKTCSGEKHSEHKSISEKTMNYYCIEHMKQFSSFCKTCNKNICIECQKHKDHKIYELDILIILEDDLNKIIKKSEKINTRLNDNIALLDAYKEEFIERINILKNIYLTEMNILNVCMIILSVIK